MIDLKARQKFVYFSVIKRVITTILGLPMAIWGTVMFLISIIRGYNSILIPLNIFLIFSIVACCVAAFFMLFQAFYLKKLRRDGVYQFFEIVNTTKINGNPKVVYAYTCHNDLIESRLLQSSQQTYKNIEIWVIDGSNKENLSNKYEDFAKNNGFKYFRFGSQGSNNKAENLNKWLLNSGVTFDYLLVTDSDEVLHKDFVDNALRCFNNECFNNLGYVTPLNYFYGNKTLFNNVMLNFEGIASWKDHFTRTITLSDYSNLYSASCLISKNVLQDNDGRFPDGCLEDIFMEHKTMGNGYVSIILPTASCGQGYDENVVKFFNRSMRIYDWQIKLAKTNFFDNYNEKHSRWYSRMFLYAVFTVPLMWIAIGIAPLAVWFIVRNILKLIKNPLFISLVGTSLSLGICGIISSMVDSNDKTCGNNYMKYFGFIQFCYAMSTIPQLTKHWFRALILGKYSNFAGSNDKYAKYNKVSVKPYIVIFIVALLGLAGFVTWYALFIKFTSLDDMWLLLFFYVCIILIIILLICFGMISLFICSKIIINPDYDESKFIYPREFYNFKEIKEKCISNLKKQGKEIVND